MKILAFESATGPRLGVVGDDTIIDLQEADQRIPADLMQVLATSDGDLASIGDIAKRAGNSARRALADIRYALPIARPGKIICLGLNYLEHVKEGVQRDNIPKYPSVFLRGATSLVAHEQPILRPRVSEQLDYEAELVAIVGRRARNLTNDTALSCIAGYSCFNEGSIRDFQRHTTQWTMGKNFDRTGAFGPWIVTADELPSAGRELRIESRLNGAVMQSDNTSNMMFPLVETLVYLTQGMTLEPGDLIVTGTPSGVGYPRKPPVFMKPGDVMEIEIEQVGILRNTIEDEV
jgi:2-keto-4-pentenoate hydratase/2-oxohepta-3-ene-1,7-dioic acid hydratase in catechol pathway